MKIDYNLELRLLTPSQSFNASLDHDAKYHNYSMLEMFNAKSSSPIIQHQEEQQQKQMIIFYNGQMVVSDITQVQARTIIQLASREIQEGLSSPMNSSSSLSSSPTTPLRQPYSPTPTDISMKRSLQSFLQKRKHRAQAASPYHRQLAS